PYGGLALQPSGAVGLLAEVVADALVSGRFDFAPSPNLQASAGHTRFFGDTVAPLVGSAIDDHRTDVFTFVRPGGLAGPVFFQLDGVHLSGATRGRTTVRAFATTRLLGTRVDAGVRYTRARRQDEPAAAVLALEARGFQVYTGSARWLRRTLFRAEAVVEPDSGVRRVAAGVARAFGSLVQVDLMGDWDRTLGGASVELGLTVGLPALRFFSRNRYSEETGVVGTEQVEGSLLWDRRAARMVAADGRSLGRAGLAGIVYVDEDGDGAPGDTERRLPGVRVRVGPISTVTDERGRFAAWDLIPFELTEVEIDPGSVRDPLIAPAVGRFLFRPDPNVFTPLPLAFVPTGEVTGRVVFGPAGQGVGSLTLELVNLDTDDRYPTISFSDGTFYVLGLRPGRYRVVVSPDDLARLNLAAEQPEFTVGRRREEALVDGIVLRLSRAPD
ncbi:MAG TPA: carboxypeptidase-like regulatory domain-containing protein, partial [Gemmatimonadales bacterium]|nr:carboxypeptidase-like regulatory domain-containing protein [Gemmatimonadales bacterium]